VIEVSNLTKRYRNRAVVDAVSFAVAPGRVTGFLGRNGAGKSTTMRMMLDLTRPDQGSVTIGGRRYADLRYPIRQVGAVLESAAPHRSLTVAGHLSWVAQSNRIASGRIAEVLELMDLTDAARKRVSALSLGMGQRLALASALLGDPDVLILDEPTNGLDAEGIRWLRELLRRMAADGKIVFLSSHLMTEMSLVADHLLIIHQGRIIADTSVADFIGKHARSYSRVRTPRAAQLIWEIEGTGGTPVLAADGSLEIGGMTTTEVRKLAEEKGIPLEELSAGYGSLEDAFLSVISSAGVDGKAGK
jgi:ABC-2 type transport system ATP-binding protein